MPKNKNTVNILVFQTNQANFILKFTLQKIYGCLKNECDDDIQKKVEMKKKKSGLLEMWDDCNWFGRDE